MTDRIQVYLRLKKGPNFGDLYTVSGDTLICSVPQSSHRIHNLKNGDSVKQMAMQQRLSSESTDFLDKPPGVSISIWISFAEIYNEQIYDLLLPDPPRGQQRSKLQLGCSNGNTYIKNLTTINVSSELEAYQILQYGIHNLNSTKLNSGSSRSHAIFTIKLVQVSGTDVHTSSLNFCDLSGSERTKMTKNVGDKFKESNSINNSLLVLGRCISAMRKAQKQNKKLVPLRESKLTQLFQNALTGHENIAMMVTINPKCDMFDETQHVLNFSAVAQDIAIERRPGETFLVKRRRSRFTDFAQNRSRMEGNQPEGEVEELRNAVLFLQNQLELQHNEFEFNLKLSHDFIAEGYEKLVKEVKDNVERRVKDAERYIMLKYEMKLMSLNLKYKEILMNQQSESSSVVHSKEDTEELKEKIKELKKRVAELEKAVALLKLEVKIREQQIRQLQKKEQQLRNEWLQMENILNEAVKDFIELQQTIDKEEKVTLELEKTFL
ncbi:Kinesin domain containing protein, partial [Asbolus verrucosus]